MLYIYVNELKNIKWNLNKVIKNPEIPNPKSPNPKIPQPAWQLFS